MMETRTPREPTAASAWYQYHPLTISQQQSTRAPPQFSPPGRPSRSVCRANNAPPTLASTTIVPVLRNPRLRVSKSSELSVTYLTSQAISQAPTSLHRAALRLLPVTMSKLLLPRVSRSPLERVPVHLVVLLTL